MDRAVDAVKLGSGVDMSLLGLFLQADIVVKIVMLMLIAASVWVWAIVFEKLTSLRRATRAADGFEDRFWSGGSLDELYDTEGAKPGHPMAAVFGAAMTEWRRSTRAAGADIAHGFARERVERAMNVTISREMEALEKWMIFLASVGSTAPFIGLFGTVWGIMNSFRGLGNVQSATLAVVAPGIAEALIATAIGLFAAIPAVIAYNRYADRVGRLEVRYDSFIEEFFSVLQRYAHAPSRTESLPAAAATPGGR